MCKELNEELEYGQQLAKDLAGHLEAMGNAAQAEIPVVSISGKKYKVAITLETELNKPKMGMYGETPHV